MEVKDNRRFINTVPVDMKMVGATVKVAGNMEAD